MKRKVAFVGTMVAVMAIGLIALGSADSPQHKQAAPEIGLRADVSQYRVTVDDHPLEGQKVLHVLGDTLFLNMHPVVSPQREPHYITKCCHEMSLFFDDLVAEEGLSTHEALQRITAYANELPGVDRAPDKDSIHSMANSLNVKFKNSPSPGLIMFGSGRTGQTWLKELRTSAAREKAMKHFHRILKGLKGGSTLKLRQGQEYRLEND